MNSIGEIYKDTDRKKDRKILEKIRKAEEKWWDARISNLLKKTRGMSKSERRREGNLWIDMNQEINSIKYLA